MKTFKLLSILTLLTALLMACTDEQKIKTEKAVNGLGAYMDSLSTVTAADATAKWDEIQASFDAKKQEAESMISAYQGKGKAQFDSTVNAVTAKYDELKTKVAEEKERMRLAAEKIEFRKTLLGQGDFGDDLSFSWVNKDNILQVYQQFVDTVSANKDNYSREKWDEIKMLYEALDSRKNTVEKEGLSSADNLKIAGLKLKFAPLYKIERMGAKADENDAAKK